MQVRYERIVGRHSYEKQYLVTIRQGERVVERITVDTLSAAKKIRKAYRPAKPSLFILPPMPPRQQEELP